MGNSSIFCRFTQSSPTSEENTSHQSDARLHQNPVVRKKSNPSINVCKGDLVTQQTDVIVVCSSSQYLFNNICEAGGDSLKTLYKTESDKNVNAPVISIKASGKITSKVIYFLQWKTNTDTSVLRKSIEKFVADAMEKAVNEKHRSIAFPAIGCGKHGCSSSFVAQTMVEEAHRKLSTHPLYVSFVIQPENDDVYNEFQKQINLLPKHSSKILKTGSTTVGQGTIEVEKGDITTQRVDVIIGSSSSPVLMQAFVKAGGDEIQTAYDAEHKNNPNSILVSIPPGALPCKRVFVVKWEPVADDVVLRQSLIDLVSNVIQHVMLYKFTSIAFPAIGCGQHGCSVDIVVKTLVKEMKNQLAMRNYPLKIKFVVQSNQQNIYDEFCKQILTTQDADVAESLNYKLPSTWKKSTRNKTRFVLSPTTDEYKSLLTNFDQTMKGNYTQVIQIERIQNERWYMQYTAHRQDFQKRLKKDTEKCLYHGCPEQAANLIIEDCFNRSFAGVNGTVYGVGVYFSSSAVYSHGYTRTNTKGERCMFIAKVLVGKTTNGNSSMKTRPLGFDSTTDGNHIFVTYHDAQAYGEYLITYK